MTLLPGGGAIHIDVTVSGGRVCAVELASNRPQGLARMFVGRMADEAPKLAGQLFSLCGFSQSAASLLAVSRASGKPLSNDRRRGLAAGILAERVFETLRALVMQWPTDAGTRFSAGSIVAMRHALPASQAIMAAGWKGEGSIEAPIRGLSTAAESLGVGNADISGTLCGALHTEVRNAASFHFQPADCLSPEDDLDVVGLMRAEAGYSSRPYLPGRVVETGAFARLGGEFKGESSYLAARLSARVKDAAGSLALLGGIARGEEPDISGLLGDGKLTQNAGYGAVECARGRLYHHVEIGENDRISGYRILAPTEWNFHPSGPFVERLLMSRIGEGEAARVRISQLVALFDPCVAFEVRIKDAADA